MSDITGDGFLDMVVGTPNCTTFFFDTDILLPLFLPSHDEFWMTFQPLLCHTYTIPSIPCLFIPSHYPAHSHTQTRQQEHTHWQSHINTNTHPNTGTLSGQVHLLKSSVPAHALNSWSSFPNGRLNGFSHGIMGVSVPLEQRVYVPFFSIPLLLCTVPRHALGCLA